MSTPIVVANPVTREEWLDGIPPVFQSSVASISRDPRDRPRSWSTNIFINCARNQLKNAERNTRLESIEYTYVAAWLCTVAVSTLLQPFVKTTPSVYTCTTMREETIAEDDNGRRLDRVLRNAYPSVPPGAIAGAVRRGEIRINGRRVRNDTRVTTGDRVTVPEWHDPGQPRGRPAEPRRNRSAPAAVLRDDRILSGEWTIPIVRKSADWIALNKPAGLPSHGAGALDEIVRTVARTEGWWNESLSFRPGPVRRLDRGTSGVQLFSLTAEGARTLTEQIRRRSVAKIYLALVAGYLPRRTLCTRRLAYDRTERTAIAELDGDPGRDPRLRRLRFATARTTFYPLTFSADRQIGLVAAVPETGRTHQIRAHAAAVGIPLVNDGKYGGPDRDDFGENHRFILHAALFSIESPAEAWTAPFAPEVFGLLRNHFGDPAAVEHRLNEIVPVACTGCPADITIEL